VSWLISPLKSFIGSFYIYIGKGAALGSFPPHTSEVVAASLVFIRLIFLIQIDLGPISEQHIETRFATSIFMMHVKGWDQHQYQQLGTRLFVIFLPLR
jgi:hypothetical protein